MTKPSKSEASLENVDMVIIVIPFSTSKHINFTATFTATSIYLDFFRTIQKPNSIIPMWVGCKSFLSKQQVSTMQVTFIAFIPSPVTDQSTVYTAMKNFDIVLKQLEQDTLPVFCDRAVFRFVLNIY